MDTPNTVEKENIVPKREINNMSLLVFAAFAVVALLLLFAIGGYLVSYIFTGTQLRADANSRVIQERTIQARWGNIYSSDGYLLASTVLRYDVYWDITMPSNEVYKDTVINGKKHMKVSALCDSMGKYFPRFTSSGWKKYFDKARKKNNRYLMVLKGISQSDRDLLLTFPIFKYYTKKSSPVRSGIIINDYPKRVNPLKGIADRLLGYSEETKAYVGLEGFYASYLKGEDGSRMMQQIHGEWKPLADMNKKDPVEGKDIVLTLNANIQEIVHIALEEHLTKWNAERGCAVVMDVKTGGIRAMVNLGQISADPIRYYEVQNYAVGEKSDPGSTFKLMTFVALLEENVIDTAQKVDTDGGVFTIYGRHVRDYKAGGYGVISARKAFVKSSNTGTVKLAYNNFKDNPDVFINRLLKMKVGQKSGIDISGEPDPYIPVPNTPKWSGISLAWTSYGYEAQLTPLQTVSFYNAIANDGVYVEPHLLAQVRSKGSVEENIKPRTKGKIASDRTVKIAQSLMEGVVNDRGGTAHSACYDPDLRIAGKTGTAQYNYGKGQPMQYMVSFAGYFPYDQPQYSIVVCVYKPQGWPLSGGYIAAPIAKEIAKGIYSSTPKDVYSCTESEIENVTPSVPSENKKQEISASGNTMPKVKGMYVTDVVASLEKMGLSVTVKGGVGIITDQSIVEGVRISKGQKLTITAQ